jgi:hypothetical protein
MVNQERRIVFQVFCLLRRDVLGVNGMRIVFRLSMLPLSGPVLRMWSSVTIRRFLSSDCIPKVVNTHLIEMADLKGQAAEAHGDEVLRRALSERMSTW